MHKVIALLLCFLVGCSQTGPPESIPPDHQLNEAFYSHAGVDYKVVAWVDNPSPARGERVTVHGSLIKNGVHLGGMAMLATWPDEELEPGRPNCSVQVIYGAGVCIIQSDRFPPGEYVPVTVIFRLNGDKLTANTGFTPTAE